MDCYFLAIPLCAALNLSPGAGALAKSLEVLHIASVLKNGVFLPRRGVMGVVPAAGSSSTSQQHAHPSLAFASAFIEP